MNFIQSLIALFVNFFTGTPGDVSTDGSTPNPVDTNIPIDSTAAPIDPTVADPSVVDAFAVTSTMMFVIIGVVAIGYILTSVFLGRIFKKANQPFIAGFVPIWNMALFYRLGGYSGLWIIANLVSGIYFSVAFVSNSARMGGEAWANTELAKNIASTAIYGLPISGLLLFCTSVVGVLGAYNIGRAFQRDAGFLLLFLLAPGIWLIALAFTGYEWDIESANPNSIGEPEFTKKARAVAAREDARTKERASAFLRSAAPPTAQGVVESDYDRAVREQNAMGSIPEIKEPKGRFGRKSKVVREGRIADVGSNDPNIDPDWL